MIGFSRILIVCLPCLCTSVFAQEMDPIIENLVDSEDGMTDIEDLGRLEVLLQNPLDLNRAGSVELEQLPWITGDIAQSIIRHRKENGAFYDIDGLRKVDAINDYLLDRIRPFLVVMKTKPEATGRWRTTRNQHVRHSGERSSRTGVQTDFTIGKRLNWGARLERPSSDAIAGRVSGYLELRQMPVFSLVVLGNYTLEYGQGLLFGSTRLRRIDGLSSRVKWRPRGVVPAKSQRWNGQFTGFAVTTRARALDVTAFSARMGEGRHLHGTRVGWQSGVSTLGATAAMVAIDGMTAVPHLGVDLDIYANQVNIFGEAVFRGESQTDMIIGLHWSQGSLDGGARLKYSGAVNRAVASRIRYRPDARTIAVFTIDIRPTGRGVFSTLSRSHTLRIRRRLARTLTLSGMARRETDPLSEHRETRSRMRGQVDWNISQHLRLRARSERRARREPSHNLRESEHIGLAELRYRSRDGLILTGRWAVASGGRADLLPKKQGEAQEDTGFRRKWTVFIRSPIVSRTEISIRYAQEWRQILDGRRRSDVVWTLWVSGRW